MQRRREKAVITSAWDAIEAVDVASSRRRRLVMRSATDEPPARTAPEIADAPASMSFIGLNLRRIPP